MNRKFWGYSFLFLGAVVLTASFQNCSKKDLSQEASLSTSSSEIQTQVETTGCDVFAQGFAQVIDVSQLEPNAQINVQGNTFIYSTTGRMNIDQITVEALSGRVMFCEITVDKLMLKSGRLDLIRSHVLHALELNGTVKKDSESSIQVD